MLVPDLPQDVLALVARMLRRHADARPGDLREVEEVLERYTSVRVPPFSEPGRESPLPPDSSPVSAPRAVVELEEKSDPYAATELLAAVERGPSPVANAGSTRRRSPRLRRAPGASAVTLAICFMVGAWSWPRQVPPVRAPVAPTPLVVKELPLPPDHDTPLLSPSAQPTKSDGEARIAVARTPTRRVKNASTPPRAPVRDPQPDESAAVTEPQIRVEPPTWPDPRIANAPRLR